jgi:hypothetical protein
MNISAQNNTHKTWSKAKPAAHMCLFISASKIYKKVGKNFQDIVSQAKAGCRYIRGAANLRDLAGKVWRTAGPDSPLCSG